jgi:protoporphyrinogen oxidase
MGLAAAYELARQGHAPVVFEADDRIGGMAATFDFDGLQIERYYHFHCISDADFLQALDELGIADKMKWTETKMGYWLGGRLQAWGNPIALLTFKGLSPIAKFRYGLHAFTCTRRNNYHPLDNVEATGWVKRWVGMEVWNKLWRYLFELKFYEYSTNLSAAWIWTRIRRIGRSRYNLMREKLGYLEGGSDTLLNAMAADIRKNGGEIRLSSPVTRVAIENGKARGVEVGGSLEEFDAVISTIPATYIPQIMPDLPAKTLAQFEKLVNIPVACVIAKLKRPLTGYFWLNTADPAMDTPGMVEYTALRPLDCHIVYIPYYVPAENPVFSDSDDVFAEKVVRYMRTVNPELTEDDFLGVKVHRYRYAQPICTPGYLDELPPAKLPVEGVWAADTSYYYPEDRGFSESIGFGRKMAREAIQ